MTKTPTAMLAKTPTALLATDAFASLQRLPFGSVIGKMRAFFLRRSPCGLLFFRRALGELLAADWVELVLAEAQHFRCDFDAFVFVNEGDAFF